MGETGSAVEFTWACKGKCAGAHGSGGRAAGLCSDGGIKKLYEDEKEVGGTLAALEQFLGEEVQDTDKKEEFQTYLESAQTAWRRAGTAFERR